MKIALALALLLPASSLSAHDTWVQLNVARAGERQPVYADLMLGNHGNGHRDFLLASRIPLEGSTLALLGPDGTVKDLKKDVVETALEEKEGYWTARILPQATGLYCVAHTYDAIVSYAPKRSVKGAKAYFLSGPSAGIAAEKSFAIPLGHPLEIIPLVDPTALVAGDKPRVRVLFKGKPLAGVVVSAIPRGVRLAEDFDPAHEAKTDEQGEAMLPLDDPNFFLLATRMKSPGETGEGYSAGTEYSATVTVQVGVKIEN